MVCHGIVQWKAVLARGLAGGIHKINLNSWQSVHQNARTRVDAPRGVRGRNRVEEIINRRFGRCTAVERSHTGVCQHHKAPPQTPSPPPLRTETLVARTRLEIVAIAKIPPLQRRDFLFYKRFFTPAPAPAEACAELVARATFQ
jgi:hypothetical protein